MNNINVTLAPYIYDLMGRSLTAPANIDVALDDDYSIEYSEMNYFIRTYISKLDIKDHATLGTTDSNLRVELLNPQYEFFIANVNTTPEYLFCYSANTTHITNTVWVKNFEV
jgi:hypothetical protein